MIFKVERLGPVSRAEIDLGKDLILLTGPNGTGKTYLAWAVYGFFQSWRGTRDPSGRAATRALLTDSALKGAITSVADRLLASGESKFDRAALVREHGQHLFDAMARRYVTQLADDFAAAEQLFTSTKLEVVASRNVWKIEILGLSSLASWNEPWTLISLKQTGDPSTIIIGAAKASAEKSHVESFRLAGSFSEHVIPLSEIPQEARASTREWLAEELAVWLRDSRRYIHSVIFPAERIATTIFSKELSLHRAELVDEVLAMQDQPEEALQELRSRAQRYPRPIRDSLQMAGDLERWSRQQSKFADLAEYLEEHLLRGKVRVSQYGDLTFVPDQYSDVTLGMHLTASVVKSLSLLVFYLRHTARKGDFVIIDEPELNLHPDNQRLIARVLARAVNRGLKIMASTHSDYLVRELNNLIMLGQDTEPIKALRQKHGYEEAELLKPSQLGVYLFRDNTAEPVPVDETGFAIATIDEEIDRLNAVSQEIYATVFEQEPE